MPFWQKYNKSNLPLSHIKSGFHKLIIFITKTALFSYDQPIIVRWKHFYYNNNIYIFCLFSFFFFFCCCCCCCNELFDNLWELIRAEHRSFPGNVIMFKHDRWCMPVTSMTHLMIWLLVSGQNLGQSVEKACYVCIYPLTLIMIICRVYYIYPWTLATNFVRTLSHVIDLLNATRN